MDGARHNFLTGAGLSRNQDGRGGARGPFHQLHHIAHGLAGDNRRHAEIDVLFVGHTLNDPYRLKLLHP